MKAGEEAIVITETFNCPVEKVWKAVTDHQEMVKWYFDNISEFRPEVGFYTEFPVSTEERIFTHQWKITEVEPLKSISYEWRFKEYPGAAMVTMEMKPEGDGTVFTLIDEVTEDFPENIPEFERESGVEGWNYFIRQQLKHYLESGE